MFIDHLNKLFSAGLIQNFHQFFCHSLTDCTQGLCDFEQISVLLYTFDSSPVCVVIVEPTPTSKALAGYTILDFQIRLFQLHGSQQAWPNIPGWSNETSVEGFGKANLIFL